MNPNHLSAAAAERLLTRVAKRVVRPSDDALELDALRRQFDALTPGRRLTPAQAVRLRALADRVGA